jgi:hypothetical protein
MKVTSTKALKTNGLVGGNCSRCVWCSVTFIKTQHPGGLDTGQISECIQINFAGNDMDDRGKSRNYNF